MGVLPVANPRTKVLPFLFFYSIAFLITRATSTDASCAVLKKCGSIF